MNDFFFHIHYCNGKRLREPGDFRPKVSKLLQHHELMFVCNGNGSFSAAEKKYPVRRGTLLYLTPGVPCDITLDPQTASGVLTVHFSFAGVMFQEGQWSIREERQMLPLHPWQELKDAYLVEEQFQKLVDGWNAKLPGYEFAAQTMLRQLLLDIAQNLNKHSGNFAAARKVEKIIAYMHENIDRRITLPELSKLVQMTPAYLSRSFKDATGCTVIEYFNKLKIDKSKELLVEGNRKIKDVAQELGFADEFYFSRMFKRSEGITPSEFYSRIVHEF